MDLKFCLAVCVHTKAVNASEAAETEKQRLKQLLEEVRAMRLRFLLEY